MIKAGGRGSKEKLGREIKAVWQERNRDGIG
jgi:hypothetical protein